MNYVRASKEQAEEVFDLVQKTIAAVYPRYYPKEVVDFFFQHHSKEKILKDIKKGNLWLLLADKKIVGTGSYKDNHITRVYVDPDYQGQGYGSYIMQNLENEIFLKHEVIYLDASLPASRLYEKLGYITVKHEKLAVTNGAVLVYEIMRKERIVSDILNG